MRWGKTSKGWKNQTQHLAPTAARVLPLRESTSKDRNFCPWPAPALDRSELIYAFKIHRKPDWSISEFRVALQRGAYSRAVVREVEEFGKRLGIASSWRVARHAPSAPSCRISPSRRRQAVTRRKDVPNRCRSRLSSVVVFFLKKRTPGMSLEVNPPQVHRIGSVPLFAQSVLIILAIKDLFFFIIPTKTSSIEMNFSPSSCGCAADGPK